MFALSLAAFAEVRGLRGAFLLRRRFVRFHIAVERTRQKQHRSVTCRRKTGNLTGCVFLGFILLLFTRS